jgi:hypothetical protein
MAHANQHRQKGPTVLVGTGNEVSRLLNRSADRRAVAVTFADDEESVAAENVLRRVTHFLPHLIRQRRQDSLEKLVGALLPEIVISDAALVQARMLVEAKSHILASADFLPAGKIAEVAGYSEKNPSAQPNRWKKNGAIFAIQHKGVDYFPLYALNPDENYRPYKAVAEILRIFGQTKTGWGLSFWFAGLNSFLDNRRPQDLLSAQPDRVIAAARDELEGVQHG